MVGRRAAVTVSTSLAALALVAPARAGTAPGASITATGSVAVGSASEPGGANADTAPAFMATRPATSIRVTDASPVDGLYHPMGTLTVAFGAMLRDPRVHLYDLGDFALATRLVVAGGAPALVPRTGWPGWLVTSTQIAPRDTAVGADDCGCGTVQLSGTFDAVTFRIDAARTSIGGVDAGTTDTFRVNVSADEDLGNAPASYGGAAHLLSDLTIGPSATGDATSDLRADAPPGTPSTDGNDGAVSFPPISPLTTAYAVDVPVAGVSAPAELAGWIDFDGDGRFDAGERARVAVPAGAATARLFWNSVPTVVPGTGRAARLRLGYDAADVDSPTGLATSGEVEDYSVAIANLPTGSPAGCVGSAYALLGAGGSAASLGTVDLATGAVRAVGPLDVAASAFAVSPLDRLGYAVTPGSARVTVVDPATGATLSTFVPAGGGSPMPPGAWSGAAFAADGSLYLLERGSRTIRVVTASHRWRSVTFDGPAAGDADIAVNPADGAIYLADPATRELSRIDPASGARTSRGTLAGTGLLFDSIGDLYAVSGGAAGVDVNEVDLTGGTARAVPGGARAAGGVGAALVDAGGCVVARDFGDAPASYSGGVEPPSHGIVAGLHLGAGVGAEPGPVAGRDDDDALAAFPAVDVRRGALRVTVTLADPTGGPVTLAGWIDADGDGRFGAGERATATVPAGADHAELEWSDLIGRHPGATFARLRLYGTTVADPSPTGAAVAGEVEDYPVRMHALPAVTTPADGALLGARTPVISGTAEAGGVVTVTEDRAALCRADVTAAGTWACAPAGPLADGPHTVVATNVATDGDRQPGAARTFRVDATAPAAPVLGAPADGAIVATGHPTWRGTGEAGATVTVTATAVSSVATCQATVAIDGTWSCTPAGGLADGAYEVKIVAVDLAGNHSPALTAGLRVDTEPPPAPVIGAPVDGATIGGGPALVTGTGEAGDTVTVASGEGDALCVAPVPASGFWSCLVTRALPDGRVVLTPTATDPAGNSTPGTPVSATVDTTAPPAALVTRPAPGSATNSTSPVMRGTGEAGDTVRVDAVDGPATASCAATVSDAGSWTCRLAPALPATAPTGDVVTLRATQTDRGGNTATGTPLRLLVDTVAPPAGTVTTPGPVVNTVRPSFGGRAEPGSSVSVRYGPTMACVAVTASDGIWSCVATQPLPAGTRDIVLTTRDRAGNLTESPARSLTIDTTPPPAPTIDTPAAGGVTNQPRPVVGGHGGAGDTVEVSGGDGATLCTATVADASTWTCTSLVTLADGTASLTATATDPAGNVTPGDPTVVTVDTTPPPAASVSAPVDDSYVADRDPLITGTAEPGATVTVADASGAAVCTAVVGSVPLVSLVVRAEGATAAWSCRPARPFGDGPRRLVATVTDPAGNSTPGTAVTFTVDTVAPAAPRLTAPTLGLVTRVARIAASGTAEPWSTVALRAGGDLLCTATTDPAGTWACRSTSAVADGVVPLRATATDRAGNATDGGIVTVTVDTEPPPAATITSPAPGEIVLTSTPVVRGTGEADDTVIVEGSGGRTVCVATVQGDGSWSCPAFDDLPDGEFTLNTYALDAAGNSTHGTAVRIRIGAAQPVAATVTAPSDGAIVASATPLLGGQGEAGDTVQVLASADGGAAVTACVAVVDSTGAWSCRPVAALPQGRVTLMPTTIDADGTRIPGSAIAVTVDSVPPKAPTLTSPAAGAIVRTTMPRLAGRGEAGTVVEVTGADGGTVCAATVAADGHWSCPVTRPFAAGPTYVTPTASDAAGNVTPGAPAGFTVTP